MKYRILSLVVAMMVTLFNPAFAQTADEVISRYVEAIGGKDQIHGISSLYIESKAVVANLDAVIRTTVLNGLGYKTELDLTEIVITTCFTENGGWSINPLTGSTAPAAMSSEQYSLGKDQIFIGAPFIKYKEMGYKAEFIGNEMVDSINAVKIELTTAENVTSLHYFDPATGYLIKTVRQDVALGQKVESTILYSDYRESNGYTLPYKTTVNQGGLYEIPGVVTKVEVNAPLDMGFFEKPVTGSEELAIDDETLPVYESVYENSAPVCDCEDLVKATIPNTNIESAVVEPRDSSCHITAIVTHPPFNDKVTVTIALPAKNWNGRFQGLGGGGFTGGMVWSLFGPVSQGFAAGVTDGGHPGGSGSFAYDQEEDRLDWQSIRNFSHVAIHDMTVVGKALVQVYYGKPARYSYFVGGSNGGRQALEEVQRYPEDYEGVLALCPAVYWNHFLLGFLWPQAVMNDMNNLVSRQKLIAVTDAVIAACDGDDGLIDGVIDDPFSCKWDPEEYIGTKVGESFFTEADANVVRKIWEGPRGHDDKFLWDGLTRGTKLYDYAATKGDPLTGAPNALGTDWVGYFLIQDTDYDGMSISCEEYETLFVQSVEQYASLYETSETDLSRFRDHGSKLIITQGLADNLIPPQGIIKYYELLQEDMGGAEATSEFARLFLFPGLDHGFMGSAPSPDNDDLLGSLIQWVEEGKAPETINAEVTDDSGEVIRSTSVYPYEK